MFFTAIALAALAFPGPELTKDQRETLSAVQKAYEANRLVLGMRGLVRFHGQQGLLDAAGIDDIDRAMASDWRDENIAKGLYVFDAPYRRFESVYPTERQIATVRMVRPDHWASPLSSRRLLTDGETTLDSSILVVSKERKLFYHGNLREGSIEFFRNGFEIPLAIGSPSPPWWDLGSCLRDVLGDGKKATLTGLDDKAQIDGQPVLKIEIQRAGPDPKPIVTYWVDLEHGAIPLRFRVKDYVPHVKRHVILQTNQYQPRWVGKGWLPTRWCHAEGLVSEDGSLPRMRVHECLFTEVSFTDRPNRSMFALEFPEDMPLSDSDRELGFGTRKVWDVEDFSPAARAKARPLRDLPAARAQP